MRIVVEIGCRDPDWCTDCDFQCIQDRPFCQAFNQPLHGDIALLQRCDECKAAEAYIERCDRMFTDNAEPDEAGL